jgi:1,2-diacylglycerol 3-alpha-glucosyltransferase
MDKDKMKRVCMLVFNSLNPDPRVWKESRTLALQGFDITIVAMRKKGQNKDDQIDGFRILRIFSDYPLKLRNLLVMLKVWVEFISFLLDTKRLPFDICHCHDPDTLLFGYAISKKDTAVLIYDSHEFVLDFLPPMKGHFFHLLKRMHHFFTRILPEKVFIRKCDHVITVNASISRLIKASYRLKKRPTYLLNTLPYEKEVKELETPRRVSHDAKRFMLFQGVISWDRQLENIIGIMPNLDKSINLRLIGPISPRYKKELSDFAEQKGVYDRIEFGEVSYPDLIKETARSDLGICLLEPKSLSYKYSLPNKFFDYIFAGIPVIVSDLPEMRRLVKRFQIGAVVDIKNPDEVISAIRAILSAKQSEAWYRDMLRHAAKALCWENEEKKLIDIYRRVASSRSYLSNETVLSAEG